MTYSYETALKSLETISIIKALYEPQIKHQTVNRKNNERNRAPSRFNLSRVIGEGGLGVVKDVYDSVLGKRLAKKTVRDNMPLVAKAREILLREAQITASLDHPNIIPVYNFGVDEDLTPYFTMKLVEGRTLSQILGATSSVERKEEDIQKLLQIFLQILDGIAFAHSRGVIHGDIKPENVMVGDDGQVYVIDWGNAIQKDTAYVARMGNRSPVGSPGYMSPEQAKGAIEAFDERTDIFGLGGILYAILTGLSPYRIPLGKGTLAKMMDGCVESPYERTRNQLPQRLCNIAMRAMSAAKVNRYQSVIALKREVEDYLASVSQDLPAHDQLPTKKAA